MGSVNDENCISIIKKCYGLRLNPHLLTSSAMAGGFFTTSTIWEAQTKMLSVAKKGSSFKRHVFY